ncbi:MAG: 4-hydroxythreonine-4-phosphate dehydrogenase PdxA [Psychroflexus sp.]|nr:4-hydroxythreonine-4-phosphate dehydrogenase PdxA [Psychroflexus sp.]
MIERKQPVNIAISIGDLNSIGPEVVMKAFSDHRMFDFCTPVVFASKSLMNFYRKHFDFKGKIQPLELGQPPKKGKLNVVDVFKEKYNVSFGKRDKLAAEFAVTSFIEATKALKNNQVDVLVTAPLDKHLIQSDEFNFPGHTDYLAKAFNGDHMMLLVNENLRVGLLTDHVALKDVVNHLSEDLITRKLHIIKKTLQQDFGIRHPRVAVLGINPHSGDEGLIGDEDEKILKPTIEKINEEQVFAYGPYAADGFFGSKNYKNFDAVIASYHDQGLIPFKTLSFGSGVNFTAGLSHIRTSPDHGTAFDIAGKNIADPSSFIQAIYTAIDCFHQREEYQQLTADPLN